jgi:plasmid stability protein
MRCLHSASINGVGTLYVRDVPAPTLNQLRARARSNGRSLNAEVLEILDEVTSRGDAELIAQRLEALAARIGVPANTSRVEDLIREDRESH